MSYRRKKATKAAIGMDNQPMLIANLIDNDDWARLTSDEDRIAYSEETLELISKIDRSKLLPLQLKAVEEAEANARRNIERLLAKQGKGGLA